ncbi:YbaK/EbsC family protein [Clostridium sp. D33t1_170424_F3]|uniref:aminoacyl-tRNA deacylase n=1 Tax=Clostridium sp. D33t1_170424_F3 TaxID=2787099 RepID=UPI0018AB56C9|nr:YbaK/EbsC family protein [Clostridium sp. D33t1_170424_F3]
MVFDLERLLTEAQANFRLIRQDKPILSAQDAQEYYDVEKLAPTLILQTENGLLACIVSANRGRLDFEAMKQDFGYTKLKLADRKKVEKATGYPAGAVPLVGYGLPCLFDDRLLQYDCIYGGTGDPLVILEIKPQDVKRLNHILHCLP